jgi:hypothetical protein
MRLVNVAFLLFIGLPVVTFGWQRGFRADYSGTYVGELNTTSGPVANKLVLKMSGTSLKGTLKNQYGELPIKDGSVDGQDFFFYVVVKEEGDDFRMVYRGHIFQDEIQFKIEAGERQIDLVVKKVP